MPKYIAINQYGQKEFCNTLAELAEKSGYSPNAHIDKMYVDTEKGAKHTGYVINGKVWWTTFKVSPLDNK